MIRVGDRVFAVHQKDGLLVIDAKTHTLETTILKPEEHEGHGLGSIVLSKDGTILGKSNSGTDRHGGFFTVNMESGPDDIDGATG